LAKARIQQVAQTGAEEVDPKQSMRIATPDLPRHGARGETGGKDVLAHVSLIEPGHDV